MTQRSPSHAPDHAAHDRLQVAAFIAGDLAGPERELVDDRLAACRDCRELADDLRAIVAATTELPRPVRRRDFTLSPEAAHRARRRGWRRILAALAGPRFEFARPLATGLTTLGLAGLLLAAGPSIGGLPGAAPTGGDARAPLHLDRAASPDPSTGDVAAGYGPGSSGGPQEVASGDPVGPLAGEGVTEDGGDGGTEAPTDAARRDPRAASPLAVLSGSFLIVGLGLFGLRWTARRFGE